MKTTYRIKDKDYTLVELIETWLAKPKDCVFNHYLGGIFEREYKNIEIARSFLYRAALDHAGYLEYYLEFLKKHQLLSEKELQMYQKAHQIYLSVWNTDEHSKGWSLEGINESKEKLKKYKVDIAQPVVKASEEIPVEKHVIAGYENKWKKKAIKIKEKARSLFEKGKNNKALKILLKNYKKFGDVSSAYEIGRVFEANEDIKMALQYYKIAKDYGNKEAVLGYNQLYDKESFKENLYLANRHNGSDKELDYLLNAFKADPHQGEVAFRIGKILLEPGTKNTNIALGKHFLDYYFANITDVGSVYKPLRAEYTGEIYSFYDKPGDKYDKFLSYYALAYFNGTIGKKDKELAYFCYSCVVEEGEKLKEVFSNYKENERKRTYTILKNEMTSIKEKIELNELLAKEEIEKQQAARIQVIDKKETLESLKSLDELYALALTKEDKYIHEYFERKGGFEAKFDRSFVDFLLKMDDGSMYANKYLNYQLARLYSNKEACKTYGAPYSLEKAFTKLYYAHDWSKNLKVPGLDEKVTIWYARCCEDGIGTVVDSVKAIKLYGEYYYLRGKYLQEFLSYIPSELVFEPNYTEIKNYFLENIKSENYPTIFKKVQRCYELGIPMPEVFTTNGVYVGDCTVNKLISVAEENYRQAEIRRQAELRRQEELKRQAELKRQEELKRIEEERRQAELAAKKKEEERKKIESIKTSEVKKTTVEPIKTTPKPTLAKPTQVQPKTFRVPYKSGITKEEYGKYLGAITPEDYGRIIYDEFVKVAKLRASFNYPIEPNPYQEYDQWGYRLSKGEQKKRYQINYSNYLKEIENYKDRIFSLDNPYTDNYEAYRMKVWELYEPSKILVVSKFITYLEEEYKKKTRRGISIKVKNIIYGDRSHEKLNDLACVERVMCLVPIYALEITFVIKVQVNYTVELGSEYLAMSDAFNESEYSKMMTWDEFSHKTGYAGEAWQAAYNDRMRQANSDARVEMETKKQVINFINSRFDEYQLFARTNYEYNGKTQHVEGLVKSIKFDISFTKHSI